MSQVHKVFSERWKWLSIQTAVAHAYRTFLEDRYSRPHTSTNEECVKCGKCGNVGMLVKAVACHWCVSRVIGW